MCLIVSKRATHRKPRWILLRKPNSTGAKVFPVGTLESLNASPCSLDTLCLFRECRFMVLTQLCDLDSRLRRIRAHHATRVSAVAHENCVLVEQDRTASGATKLFRIRGIPKKDLEGLLWKLLMQAYVGALKAAWNHRVELCWVLVQAKVTSTRLRLICLLQGIQELNYIH